MRIALILTWMLTLCSTSNAIAGFAMDLSVVDPLGCCSCESWERHYCPHRFSPPWCPDPNDRPADTLGDWLNDASHEQLDLCLQSCERTGNALSRCWTSEEACIAACETEFHVQNREEQVPTSRDAHADSNTDLHPWRSPQFPRESPA